MAKPVQQKEFSAERYLRKQREKNGAARKIKNDTPIEYTSQDNLEVIEAIQGLTEEIQELRTALTDANLVSEASSEDSEDMAKDVRIEIAQMVRVIAKTKTEIAQIKHPDDADDRFEKAHSELDEIVQATELATQNILAATESIEATLTTLTNMAHEDQEMVETIDLVSDQLTFILEACNFQDITGQRITKVLKTVRYIEDRILAMISIWGVQAFEDLPVPVSDKSEEDEDADLLHGPQSGNEGITQAEIDALFD